MTNNNQDWELIKQKDGTYNMKIGHNPFSHLCTVYFLQGNMRQTIMPFLNNSTDYSFIRTTANPVAKEELNKTKVTYLSCFDTEEQFLKMHNSKEKDKLVQLRFSPHLMSAYLATIKDSYRDLGNNKYVAYPFVKTDNMHNGDIPFESVSWPTIHVVKKSNQDSLIQIVNSLNGKKAQKFIKTIEAPQNYNMGEVNHLRNTNIQPLVVDPNIITINSDSLKQVLSMILPYTLRSENRNYGIDVD